MKLKLALAALGLLAAGTQAASAGGDIIYGDGMKDAVAVPAPIPSRLCRVLVLRVAGVGSSGSRIVTNEYRRTYASGPIVDEH